MVQRMFKYENSILLICITGLLWHRTRTTMFSHISTNSSQISNYLLDACVNDSIEHNICHYLSDGFTTSYSQDGDIMLGGLFPVHLGSSCSTLEDMGSIQRLEAMAFAVNKVNENRTNLKNLTLGFKIFDTCNSETITLTRTLEMLPACNDCVHYPICAPDCPIKVAGFVGPESSSNSLVAAHACNIALTPVVSYFATSVELNNVQKFPTFFRTVPSDDFQVQAMLDLMQYFGWSYISIVHSDDRYGKDAAEYMQSNMEEMCIAAVQQVSRSGRNTSYDKVLSNLLEVKKYSKSNIVVVFTDGLSANKLFQAVERAGAVGEFTWIGSEGWGVSTNDISAQLHVAEGAITFVPHTEYDKEFENYFQNLGPEHDNPWWKEIWQRHFNNCLWDVPETDELSCLQYDHIDVSNGFVPDSTVSLVTSAVYAYTSALTGYLNETYPGRDTVSPDELALQPWKLMHHLRDLLRFPNSFNVIPKSQEALYDINNLQEIYPNGFEYILVGGWSSNSGLSINDELIRWPGDEINAPEAYCSDNCDVGEAQVLFQSTCCWDCEACTPGAIVVNDTRCQLCDDYYWPDETRTTCELIPYTYLQWSDAAAIVFVVLATSNIILTKLSLMYYIKHKEDPLIRASGRELMAVIFFGIFAQNLLVYVLIAMPSQATCTISRFVFGLDFTITYAPVLVKSNRIYRIFKAGKRTPVPPKWILPRHQLIITGIFILIQIIITTVLIFMVPPEVTLYRPVPEVVELTCSLEKITVFIPLAYNFLLVFACLIYSWKTRQLPTNFRESRFITFNVFSTLILWSAFIPIYLTTSGAGSSSILRVEILASVEILSSFITLSSLFFPKFYALAFVPRSAWHLDKEFIRTTNRIRFDSETRGKRNQIRTVPTISTSITLVGNANIPNDQEPQRSPSRSSKDGDSTSSNESVFSSAVDKRNGEVSRSSELNTSGNFT